MTSCMDSYFPSAPPGDVEVIEAGGHRWRVVRVTREGEHGWSIEASPYRDDHWMPGLEEVRKRLARRVAEGMVPVGPEAPGSVALSPAAAPLRKVSALPCSKCRAATPVTELSGGPGKWTCAACAAPKQEEDEVGKTTPLTREQREQILELEPTGATREQIAEAVGCSKRTVERVIQAAREDGRSAALTPKRGGIPGGRGSVLSDMERFEILQLHAEGCTYAEITAQTGRSAGSISGVLKAAREEAEGEAAEQRDATVSALLGQLKDTVAERDAALKRISELERAAAPQRIADLIAQVAVLEVEIEELRAARDARGLEGLAAREHHAATPVSEELVELRRYRDAWLAHVEEVRAEAALVEARRRAAEAAALVEVS